MIFLAGDIVELQEKYFERAKNKAGVEENSFTIIKIEDRQLMLISKCGKRFTILENHVKILQAQKVDISFGDAFKAHFYFGNNILSSIYDRLCSCNVRSIEKNYFNLEYNKEKKALDITFMHMSKSRRISDGYYTSKQRDTSKPIRIINEILKANNKKLLTKEEEEEILASITINDFYDFQIVSGEDISKYYCEDYYENGGGSLNKSCMRHFNPDTHIFNIYKDNAEMLIMKDKKQDKIYGRALIWEIQDRETDEVVLFMDRVYTQKGIYEVLFREYAEEHNMAYLSRQYRGEKEAVYGSSKINLRNYYVGLKKNVYEYSSFPYLDTWYIVPDLYDNKLICNNDTDYIVGLTNTDGSAEIDYASNDVISWYEHIIKNDLPISRWDEDDEYVNTDMSGNKDMNILLYELEKLDENYEFSYNEEEQRIIKKEFDYEWDD